MLNRAAILLRNKEPAVRWINEADPIKNGHEISIDSANQECTIYLISDDDGDGDLAVEQWVRSNFKLLFEAELEGWYTDPDLWPAKRTFSLFQKWFEVECHSVLADTVGGEIYDDEL